MTLKYRIAAVREARRALNPRTWSCFNTATDPAHSVAEKPGIAQQPSSASDSITSEAELLATPQPSEPAELDERRRRQSVNAQNGDYYERGLMSDDEIRLLRIAPGEGGPIVATWEYESMLNPPAYDALSYCWGSQKSFREITVNGRDGFTVSEHLHAALLRLRRPDRERLVWVDVICVNQDNIPERNKSVSLIWRIYTEAKRVIIWIGEVEPGQATCKRFYPNSQEEETRLALCAEPGLAALEHGDLDTKLREILREMESASTRSGGGGEVWWKRLWVVQEFSRAQYFPTVYIGPHAISWAFFSKLMQTDHHDRLELFRSLRIPESQPLLHLLFKAKIFQCSDPKDRIYALLGLAEVGSSPIIPDYSKSDQQVFEEVTLYLIQEENTVDVLLDERQDRFAKHKGSASTSTFPTWVPDFRLLQERSLVQTRDNFKAGDGIPEVALVEDPIFAGVPPSTTNIVIPRSLQLKALYFDKITHRSTERDLPAPDSNRRGIIFKKASIVQPLETVARLFKALHIEHQATNPLGLDRQISIGYLMLEYVLGHERSIAAEYSRVNGDTKPWEAVFWESVFQTQHSPTMDARKLADFLSLRITRAAGLELNDARRNDFMVAALWESAFLWTRHTRTYHVEEHLKKSLGGSAEDYIVTRNAQERDFFSTSNGFIGLGRSNMKVGDEIIVPFGASRPFIVRPCGQHYVLIGDAVVPGIMSGQLMNLYQEAGLQAQRFLLK
nr:heterokaryon incompatibility protein 6, or allele [Quercus suber]